MNALVLIDVSQLTPATVFVPGGVETILSKIEAEVRAESYDIATPDGRDRIKSVAYKIARSKTALDDMGKDLVADIKRQAGAIDAERRTIRDRLDGLKEEIRGPLTAWEDAEAERVAGHERALFWLGQCDRFAIIPTAAMIRAQIGDVAGLAGRDWQEFKDRGRAALSAAKTKLEAMLAAAERAESDAAEVEALRREKAEREALEEAERDVAAAAERARVRAEQVEQWKRDQEARSAKHAEEAAARAVERERQRAAQAKAAEDAAKAKREANARLRKKVHHEIAEAILAVILNEENAAAGNLASAIMGRVAAGDIPHISITY